MVCTVRVELGLFVYNDLCIIVLNAPLDFNTRVVWQVAQQLVNLYNFSRKSNFNESVIQLTNKVESSLELFFDEESLSSVCGWWLRIDEGFFDGTNDGNRSNSGWSLDVLVVLELVFLEITWRFGLEGYFGLLALLNLLKLNTLCGVSISLVCSYEL